jgi:hypothetical protein
MGTVWFHTSLCVAASIRIPRGFSYAWSFEDKFSTHLLREPYKVQRACLHCTGPAANQMGLMMFEEQQPD